MHKLWASTYKEFLLLTRDIGGIAILFVMPIVLIITITIIQDSSFKTISDTKIPILLVNNDNGLVSETIINSLTESNTFEVIQKDKEQEARNLVFKGNYQLAIIIPEKLSSDLEKKVNQNVEGILSKFGLEEEKEIRPEETILNKEVRLYFDPATQLTFKSSVKNGIDKMISKIETQSIYKAFHEQVAEDDTEVIFETDNFISFKEIAPKQGDKEIIPNSAQHNVPAWTLFAIFLLSYHYL